MSLTQSHPALPIRGHRLPEEESVQADGGAGRSRGDRHRGREHPRPPGQGQKHGSSPSVIRRHLLLEIKC